MNFLFNYFPKRTGDLLGLYFFTDIWNDKDWLKAQVSKRFFTFKNTAQA
jgi:hypothetical protein